MHAQIINVKDVFNIKESSERFAGGEGFTVRQRMEQIWPGVEEFERPTILVWNGDQVMRKEWDTREIQKGDMLVFMPVVGGNIFILILIAIVIAVLLVLFLDIPVLNSANQKESDPVYGLSGQQNKNRVNEPIEKHYGNVRFWPSYAAKSYNQFIGNDQYLYSLFCIGLGEYTVDEQLISDTLISEFQEIQTEIIQPGGTVTLFPTNVQTSAEVNGLELFGPNQTGSPGTPEEGDYTGFLGGFVANASGTLTNRIEHDISFDSGLYSTNDKGGLTSLTVVVRFEHRLIDAVGDPIGGWILSIEKSITLATNTPQRMTIPVTLADGRYETRGVRINNANLSNRAQDSVKWIAVRSFVLGDQKFPDNVTLWAVKAKATNNLNNQTRSLFNVRIKSKIPVYNSATGVWTVAETRNPVWIMCDILKSEYGMRVSDSFLDLPKLVALAAHLQANNIHFDLTFDQRGKVWDACKTVMNVARAKPLMQGSLATATRDDIATMPVAGFNKRNILRNSMSVETSLPNKFEHDGLLIEYRDPENWTPETVLCLVGTDQGLNPKQIQFLGCTSRDEAYRWGLYQRAVEVYQRDNITFGTGIEGLTVDYGDLIAMKHDFMPTADDFIDEQTGSLFHNSIQKVYDVSEVFEETQILLPDAPVFTDIVANDYYITLRKTNGTLQTFQAYPTDNPKIISVAENIDLTDFEVNTNSEPATYFFGANTNRFQLGKVVGINPKENYEVELNVVPYDARLYGFDALVAPAIDRPSQPVQPPELPVILNLTVSTNPDKIDEAFVTWNAAFGATDYVVETSPDGVDFVSVARVQAPSYTLSVAPGALWVRVYGINVGAGAKAAWNGNVGVATFAPPMPSSLANDGTFEQNELRLVWNASGIATSYIVKIFLGAVKIREIEVFTNAYTYTASIAKQDAQVAGEVLVRDLIVKVSSKNSVGTSAEATVTFSNPAPVAVGSPLATFVSAVGNIRKYRFSATAGLNYDLELVTVHASLTDGFTAGPANLLTSYYPALNPSGQIDGELDTGAATPATIYFRLGAKDVWGDEVTLTAQQTFTG